MGRFTFVRYRGVVRPPGQEGSGNLGYIVCRGTGESSGVTVGSDLKSLPSQSRVFRPSVRDETGI